MHGTPPTTWHPYTFPSGRRISARFESGIRGEGNFYVPSLSIELEDEAYTITACIPGAERDELCVELQGRILRITGVRRSREHRESERAEQDARYLSQFTREICLTREVDVEGIEARFEGGMLKIRLPIVEARHTEEDEPRRIDIQ
jgi:HSP20 family protein